MNPAPLTSAAPLSILLVDDFVPLRLVVRDLLAPFPEFIVVGEAGDGDAAILMAIFHLPHVIIMDISMPRLGGIEATRRIKQILPDTYVLACLQMMM